MTKRVIDTLRVYILNDCLYIIINVITKKAGGEIRACLSIKPPSGENKINAVWSQNKRWSCNVMLMLYTSNM